jgi:hypothetical protein
MVFPSEFHVQPGALTEINDKLSKLRCTLTLPTIFLISLAQEDCFWFIVSPPQ